MSGIKGPSVYLNGFRIAGNKPWGGGREVHRFTTTGREMPALIEALTKKAEEVPTDADRE